MRKSNWAFTVGHQEVTHSTWKQKEWIQRAEQAGGKWKGIAGQLQAYYIKEEREQNKACTWGKCNWTEGSFSHQHHVLIRLNKNLIFKKAERRNNKMWEWDKRAIADFWNKAACLHVKTSRLETARDWITIAENMNGHRREAWDNYSVGKRKKPMTIRLERSWYVWKTDTGNLTKGAS